MDDLFTLKEEDIRLRLDVSYNRNVLHHKSLSLFLKNFKQNFQHVDCVSCKSKNHYVISQKDGFNFRKCNECQTVFISPRPNPKALKWWYTHCEHIKHFQKVFENTADARKIIYKDRIDKIFNRIYSPVTSVLEIGCGTGNFLKLLKELKPELKIAGIDVNPESVELTKEKGVNCLNFSAEEFTEKSTERYDLILAFEVLEHVFDPFSLIKALLKLLKKGGAIYMTMPNYLSYDFLQVGDVYRNFFGPEHLNYFNPSSITKFFKRIGCSHIEVFCDGILDTDIVGNYYSDEKKTLEGFWRYIYDNRKKYANFLIDYQKLLQKYKLSGNMTVTGRVEKC